MFLMKSLCPGASMMATENFGVSNFQRAISMVIPRSRSAFNLSNTQAYLKEPFPILGFLLEFFNGTLVNTSTFVDQVTSGGRLTRVDVTNDDNVNMSLFLTHLDWIDSREIWLELNLKNFKCHERKPH